MQQPVVPASAQDVPAPNISQTPSEAKIKKLEPKYERTVYNASYPEVVLKNFLAGFSRAFGALFVYIIFLVIVGSIAARYIMPQFAPLLKAFETIGNIQGSIPIKDPQVDPAQIQAVFDQIQGQWTANRRTS